MKLCSVNQTQITKVVVDKIKQKDNYLFAEIKKLKA